MFVVLVFDSCWVLQYVMAAMAASEEDDLQAQLSALQLDVTASGESSLFTSSA